MEQTISTTPERSRNRPQGQVILAVLLVTFPLLALLVREQSRVIDAQRLLIQQLAVDSEQLNSMRMRELASRAKPAVPAPSAPASDTQKQTTPIPKPKSHKRPESKPNHTPQEYPSSRPIPARSSI